MNTFRFRMQQLLDFRTRREEESRKALAVQLGVLQDEEDKLRRMYETVREHYENWEKEKREALGGDQFRIHHQYRQHLERAIGIQLAAIAGQRRRVEEVRGQLMQASKEKKVLEELKEKHYRAFVRKLDMLEQKFLDEIGTRAAAVQAAGGGAGGY